MAVIFTKGCNFRCEYCHNPELDYPKLMEQSDLKNGINTNITKCRHFLYH